MVPNQLKSPNEAEREQSLRPLSSFAAISSVVSSSSSTGFKLPPAGAQLQPRELLHQRRAVRVAVTLRQVAAVRAGEDSGQFLQRQQLRIERVDEGIHRFLEITQLNVVIVFG